MKRFSKKNDIVYVLDFSGSLLKKTTFEDAVKFTGVSKELIHNSIQRNCLVNSKYIFSKTPKTVVNTRYTHNPLFGAIPSEIVNEFRIQQRAWERDVHELSHKDIVEEKESARRWNLIIEENRKNRAKKKLDNKQVEVQLNRIEDTYRKNNPEGSSIYQELKNEWADNVVDSILKDKKAQEIIKIFEPFIKSILKGLMKKLNNDDVRTMQYFDKKSGLLVFLDMKTSNIKELIVEGVTKDDLFTVDPQEISSGNIKHVMKHFILKYNLI